NDNVVHVDGSIDPIRDKEIIDTELQFKDLETVEARLAKLVRKAEIGEKDAKMAVETLNILKDSLEQGKSARSSDLNTWQLEMAHSFQLLTMKPVLYMCNVDESAVVDGNEYTKRVEEAVKDEGAEVIYICAGMESDIAELETYEERLEFLQDAGLEEAGVNRLIRKAYKLLDLQTYFTAGVKEVRAWTINRGFTAPQAAGVIHTDFEKGFIRAETIAYDDFVTLGSEAAVKDAGKMSVEGKDYIVKDGDVMHFRFNV
ncbi:MAG: GTP-binding protein YchF, partial [Bacteroidia bacterium]